MPSHVIIKYIIFKCKKHLMSWCHWGRSAGFSQGGIHICKSAKVQISVMCKVILGSCTNNFYFL